MTALKTSEPSWASWQFYQQGLLGKAVKVPLGIVSRGFYRKQKRSTGEWFPVAVWIEDEGKDTAHKIVQTGMGAHVILDTAEKEEDFDTGQFGWISKYPISYEHYQHWMAHRSWPEGTPMNPGKAPAARVPVPGDNTGTAEPGAQEADEFGDQVASALAGLSAFDTIKTAESADGAQALRNRLSALATEGDAKRETEKKPWLDAGRKVDGMWQPHIRKAREAATALRTAIGKFGAEQSRVQQAAAAVAAAAGNPQTEKAEPIRIGGGDGGRRATIKPVTVPVIVDQDEVYRQFRTNPELVQLLDKLVRKVHAAGGKMTGVEIRDDVKST